MNVASGIKLAAGSGRTMHTIIPAYDAARGAGGAIAVTGTSRQGTPIAAAAAFTASGTGATTFATAALGAVAMRANCPAITDLAAMRAGFLVCPILDRLAVNPVLWPAQVFRFICMARFTAIAGVGASTDYGFQCIPTSNTSMNFQAGLRPGIQFGPIDANNFALRIRKTAAGAFTLDRQTTMVSMGIADVTKYHQYELRILSADATNNALLKVYVDGAQIGASVDLGTTAAVAPAIDANGNGWKWQVCNSTPAVAPNDIQVTEMHCIVSATEDDAG